MSKPSDPSDKDRIEKIKASMRFKEFFDYLQQSFPDYYTPKNNNIFAKQALEDWKDLKYEGFNYYLVEYEALYSSDIWRLDSLEEKRSELLRKIAIRNSLIAFAACHAALKAFEIGKKPEDLKESLGKYLLEYFYDTKSYSSLFNPESSKKPQFKFIVETRKKAKKPSDSLRFRFTNENAQNLWSQEGGFSLNVKTTWLSYILDNKYSDLQSEVCIYIPADTNNYNSGITHKKSGMTRWYIVAASLIDEVNQLIQDQKTSLNAASQPVQNTLEANKETATMNSYKVNTDTQAQTKPSIHINTNGANSKPIIEGRNIVTPNHNDYPVPEYAVEITHHTIKMLDNIHHSIDTNNIQMPRRRTYFAPNDIDSLIKPVSSSSAQSPVKTDITKSLGIVDYQCSDILAIAKNEHGEDEVVYNFKVFAQSKSQSTNSQCSINCSDAKWFEHFIVIKQRGQDAWHCIEDDSYYFAGQVNQSVGTTENNNEACLNNSVDDGFYDYTQCIDASEVDIKREQVIDAIKAGMVTTAVSQCGSGIVAVIAIEVEPR